MPEHSIRELADAIHKLHGCDSTHIGTVAVTETFEDEVVWTGEVEIFELIDHPITQRAYAWAYETDSGKLAARGCAPQAACGLSEGGCQGCYRG